MRGATDGSRQGEDETLGGGDWEGEAKLLNADTFVPGHHIIGIEKCHKPEIR